MQIEEFYADTGIVKDAMRELEDLKKAVETILKDVERTIRNLTDQSEGGTAEQLKATVGRMVEAVLSFLREVGNFIRIVLNAMSTNETTDREGATDLKTVMNSI